MGISNKIDKIFSSANFQAKIKEIQEIAEKDLRDAVQTAIYDQPEGSWYTRTYDFINSITSTDLQVTPNSIKFKVIFDSSKMHHYSLFGSSKYGLDEGDPVGGLIVPWLNYGWRWEGYTGKYDNFRARRSTEFIEEAIEKIKADVVLRIKDLISVEVRKIGFRK